MAYFLCKMISAKTKYKTHDGELLAIVETFKTWRHYLEGCKHKVFILFEHNNFQQFMDTKSLSSCQVCWAQKLSHYHFWIDYCQGKANGAANALFCFPQQDNDEEANFWAENTWIFHRLQSSMTNATISSLNTTFLGLSPQHQVLIYRTYALAQLWRFWSPLQTELANEQPYKASIGSIRLRLQELQKANCEVREVKQQKADGYKKVNKIFYYQDLPFVPKAIQTKLIIRQHNNPLAGHFVIKKTRKLLARKYYWPILRHDIEAYVKGYDICLASKAVRHKPYGDLQLLLIPMHPWKDLSMDFVTDLPVSINWKRDSYDFILVINDWLTKMVYYKPVKITLDAPGFAKVIIDIIVRHHGLPDSIVINRSSFFTSKFWSLLCYFLGIKQRCNVINHGLIINQSCDFSLILAKTFILAKTLQSNLLIYSHWLFLIDIINPINLSSDILSDLIFSIRMNLIRPSLSVGIQFYAPTSL